MRAGRRQTRRFGIAALVVAALVATSCGDDDDGTSAGETTQSTSAGGTDTTGGATDTTAATTDTTTAATDTTVGAADTTSGTVGEGSGPPEGEPIRIGYIAAQTGIGSANGVRAVTVAMAWADHVNENRGIAGRPVEIVAKDSRGDAASALAAAEEVIGDDSIVATLVTDPAADDAMGPPLSESDILVIGGTGYSGNTWSALPDYVSIGTTFPALVTSHVTAALGVGATSFAAAVCAETPACAQAEALYRPTTEAAGIEFGGLITVAASAPNYNAECLQFVGDEIEFVQLSITADVIKRIAEDCTRQGFGGWLGASSGTAVQSDLETIEGAKFAGSLNGFPWWADAPPAREYVEVMEAAGADYGDPTASSTWTALELFRKTMDGASGEVTRASVADAYYSIDGETLDGLLPQPLTLTEGQPAPIVNCFWLYTYEVGAESFEAVPPEGESGNGATGDLASHCSAG